MAEFGFITKFYFVKNTWFFKKLFPCKNVGLQEKLLLLTSNFWTPLFCKTGRNFCQLGILFFQETSKKF